MHYPRGYSVYPEPPGLKFTESWCTDLEKSAIEHSYNRVRDLDGLIIEIGSFEGRSSVFTANLVYPEVVHCIDPWVPVEYADYEVMAYSTRPIKENFDHNMQTGTKGNYEAHQTPYEAWFEENWQLLEAEGIKYLYLDGPHGYEDVQLGLRTVMPYMKPGGVLLGDDYDDAIVKRAVDDFFGVESCYHPRSNRTFEWLT